MSHETGIGAEVSSQGGGLLASGGNEGISPNDIANDSSGANMLDLGCVVDISHEEIIRVASGKAFTAVLEGLDHQAWEKRDRLEPEVVTGMRDLGVLSKCVNSRVHVTMNIDSVGVLRTINTGNEPFSNFRQTWYTPNWVNSVSGAYRVKAVNAINAEASAFDTAFYRMQRKDAENLMGYLVAYLNRGGSMYVSFFQEALGHMFYGFVEQRNLIDEAYGNGLTVDYALGEVDEDDDVGWEEERGVRVNRLEAVPLVEKKPPFGILWPDPADVGPPGGDDELSWVRFIPVDMVMDDVISETLAPGSHAVFVSKAKDASALAQDILALYAASRTELGIFPGRCVMILATIRSTDFARIMRAWELVADTEGDLRDLAHWLRFRRGFRTAGGRFVTSKTDTLRCRDYGALSSVVFGFGDRMRRVHNTDEEPLVHLPFSTWQARLCFCYAILELEGDQLSAVRSWRMMQKLCATRAVDLGAMIDFVSQQTVGSRRNLRLFNELRQLALPLELGLAYVTNKCKTVNDQWLCFRYDWEDSVPVNLPMELGLEVIDAGVHEGEPHAVDVDDNFWWIESRMTWMSVQCSDLDYLIKTDFKESDSRGVARFGSGVVYSHLTDRRYCDRLVSMLVHELNVEYQYTGILGRQSRRLCWTNSRLPSHYVHWSHPLDIVLKGQFSGEDFRTLENGDHNVVVGFSATDVSGHFFGLAEYSGLQDF